MSTLLGAILASVFGTWLAVERLLDKRKTFNHERSVTAACKRESPTDAEWAGFARATNPDNQVNH